MDEVVFIHYLDEQVAAKEVQAGKIDAYFWRVPLGVADELKRDPRVRVYQAPGGSLSLLLNPAPSQKEFNPFTIRDVRFALNYLINREFIVNEILRGYGASMIGVYGQFDPDYLIVSDDVDAAGIRYNPEVANRIITEALTKAGAAKRDGKWLMNDRPITLKFFIRGDDPNRNALGEALASELEKTGFTISRNFGDLNKAYDQVYGSDPKMEEWHLYTEGWGRSAFERYDIVTIAQMFAPWYGQMPGFGEPSYWNYQNKQLDEITQKISTGDFTSKEERDQLLRQANKLGIEEAVRIFIASLIEPYVARPDLKGLINDFGAGITGRMSLLNARFGDTLGGSLRLGIKQIYQGSWNPVAGLSDWYSTRMWYAVYDPASWRNPYTGDILPVRNDWIVQTAGPKGKLNVPPDAQIWDVTSQSWRGIGSGVTATSKVTYKPKYGTWHHGQPMGLADIMDSLYFLYEWGTRTGESDRTYDPEFTSRAEPLLKTIKGVRVINADTIEAFVDYWHFDQNYIADYFTQWSSIPWEISAASERVVLDKKAAFSRSASRAQQVEWLSLIIKSNADLIKQALAQFRDAGFIPKHLEGLVTGEEAQRRYEAAIRFIEERNHSVISNGPFYVQGYNPDARTVTLRVFKDPNYPSELGMWKRFEVARTAEIKRTDVPPAVEIGKPATLKIFIEVGGQASSDATVNYRLLDPDGKASVKGAATPSEPKGTFEIRIDPTTTSNLKPGAYSLKVFAVSNDAIKPDIFETRLLVSSTAGIIEQNNQQRGGPLGTIGGNVQQQVGIGVLALVVLGVAVFILRKRRPKA